MNRILQVVVIVLVIITAVFGYMARNRFFAEAMLVGEWQHSYHDYFYPKYSSTLTIRPDKTFTKTEEYTHRDGAPTIVSTFEGTYLVNAGGIQPGQVAFSFHDATAKLDGKVVVDSPTGGFTSICHYAFDVRGNLLITELVNGITGNRKNPEELLPNKLIPSFEHYSRVRRGGAGHSLTYEKRVK